MKHINWTKIWLRLMIAFLPLTSCQDEDSDIEVDQSECIANDEDNEEDTFTLKKTLIRKEDSVFCYNYETLEYDNRYTTIKFYNTKKKIMQEWLLEDWHEKGYCDIEAARLNDTDGTKHGYYYPWEGNLSDIDYEELFVRKRIKNGDTILIPEKDFHIPTLNDMIELDELIGKDKVREKLNIKFDGMYFMDSKTWTVNYAWFWIDPRDYSHWPENDGIDPGKLEGCGVLAQWFPKSVGNGTYRTLNYTNNKNLCANVRFMRTITKEQW